MNKQITLLLCVLLSFSSFSQADLSDNVKWSELITLNKKSSAPTVIGQDGQYMYLIRYVKKKKYLEKYSLRKLTLEKSLLFDLAYQGKDLNLLDCFMFDNKPTFYTSHYDKKQSKSTFFIQTINKNSLVISPPKKVSERDVAERKGLAGLLVNNTIGKYGSSMIRSKSKELGIFWSGKHELRTKVLKKGEDAGPTNEFVGALYDSDLQLLSEIDVTLPYEQFSTMQIRLGEDGILYLLGYEYELEESERLLSNSMHKVAGNMHIIMIDTETGDLESVDVETEEMEIESLRLKLLDKGGMQLVGLSSTAGRGVSGAFAITFDDSFEEINNISHEFETDFITTTWSNRQKKKQEKKNKKADRKGEKKPEPVFYDYFIDYVLEKPDGSTIMLAEQYYVRVVTTTHRTANGGSYTTTTYYYYYNDIIVVNFNKDGEFEWKTLVEKKQTSVNDGGYYSSYFVVQNENDVNVVYNDRESNMDEEEELTKSQAKSLRRKIIGVQVNVNDSGEQTKGRLFEFDEEVNMRLVPKKCEITGEGLAFIYARGRKGDKLGTLTVD
jgi:hypothetical protein